MAAELMSRWYSEINVGFLDNFDTFKGRPGLLTEDCIYPTQKGNVIIFCNIIPNLMAGLVNY